MKTSPQIEDLPDYSDDWRLPDKTASNEEIEARFYYEFSRESLVVLTITNELRHFTEGEVSTASIRTLRYPGSALGILHPYCERIAHALMPVIDLQNAGWNKLSDGQRQELTLAFTPQEHAVRSLNEWEFSSFIQDAIGPKGSRNERRPVFDESKPRSTPIWNQSTRFNCTGIQDTAIRIDWNQGSQAVKSALDRWFRLHKKAIEELRSHNMLPGNCRPTYSMFRTVDPTGAKAACRKHLTALRGLGAMRLLGTHTVGEAIEITKTKTGKIVNGKPEYASLYSNYLDPETGQPAGTGSWNRGVDYAAKIFQELFYRSDDYSIRMRKLYGLPVEEKPVSYQRFLIRREK